MLVDPSGRVPVYPRKSEYSAYTVIDRRRKLGARRGRVLVYPNESARRPKDDESRVLVDSRRTGIQSSWTEGGGVLQSTSAQGGRS